MDKVYLLLLLLFLAVSWAVDLGTLAAPVALLLALAGLVLAIRYLRVFVSHLLWPLRNRLRVTFVFVGAVPILLLAILAAVGVYILSGQIASFLLRSELERRGLLLAGPCELVAVTPPDERSALVERIFPYFDEQYPGLEMCVRSAHATWVWPAGSSCDVPPAGWGRTNGLVSRDNRIYLWVHTGNGDTELTMTMPVPRAYLNGLVPGLMNVEAIGRVDSVSTGRRTGSPASPKLYRFGRNQPGARPGGASFDSLPKANWLDFSVNWQTALSVAEWATPGSSYPALLAFNTRPSAVWDVLSRRSRGLDVATDFTQYFAVIFFVTICVAFLIVEACSLMAGLKLARNITSAVENLYEGTQYVMRGRFQHRVLVTGTDQLADLNRSFNRMTENLEALVAVSKEKERMQSELEIAREVQAGLYPKDPPKFEHIELVALSEPARMASGDYFDYLQLADKRVVFAIGDVAGKGIPAALLMASIQSTMRAQLRPYLPVSPESAEPPSESREELSTSVLVSRLNQQIYQFTSSSKFATFFLGVYDDRDGVLRYTNAGHLPPLLMRDGVISRLNVDGLVVGAFAFATYEQSEIRLKSGDILVLYTDGITEAENEYGEEFGEARLHALLLVNSAKEVRELSDIVVRAVRDWSGAVEQSDDITLVVVKKT